ncbi:MAG: hypothetical protein MZV63_21940 [Marinilabiliales bacterium]|nr:hypothetical protein [Marinilabiliales bacterium]
MPEQESATGRVLHDAVYDFTGRVDFVTMVDRLYREEMAYGKVGDPKDLVQRIWQQKLKKIQFLTETARKLRSVSHGGATNCPSVFCR